ncbi:PDZ and LIM domain 1 [Gossypium arboreum]|uniref:PDZ and LIM domain 1 n=1 Tax=Gossypium arboreum TaxID=29729 RepID=A0A0B0N6T4_GOSAR|nr:PDZ and LIM domain 1 [Gossypium arboreum]
MGECFPCFGSSNKEGSNGGGSVKKLSKKDSTKDSSVGQPHHVNRVSSDRATEKDAQTTADIIEEIDVEDVATTNTHEERNDFNGCEADVSLDNMDLSATQSQPPRNQSDFTFSKKKIKYF